MKRGPKYCDKKRVQAAARKVNLKRNFQSQKGLLFLAKVSPNMGGNFSEPVPDLLVRNLQNTMKLFVAAKKRSYLVFAI